MCSKENTEVPGGGENRKWAVIIHTYIINMLPFALWLFFLDCWTIKIKALEGGADKSLAWPTSWCCRMESIVSLERGVCSCAELQVFSCYRDWKEACQATRAISTTWRRELSSSFFSRKTAPKEIYTILTETLGEHAPLYATVKNWVAQFQHGDFQPVMHLIFTS